MWLEIISYHTAYFGLHSLIMIREEIGIGPWGLAVFSGDPSNFPWANTTSGIDQLSVKKWLRPQQQHFCTTQDHKLIFLKVMKLYCFTVWQENDLLCRWVVVMHWVCGFDSATSRFRRILQLDAGNDTRPWIESGNLRSNTAIAVGWFQLCSIGKLLHNIFTACY